MRYNLIQIRPKFPEEGLEVIVSCDDEDRIAEKTEPNIMGFYYCPKRISVKKGFQILKTKLLEDVDKEFTRLNEYKKQLEELELPQK